MATLEQLSTALVNADKAGDAVAAQAFANEIRKMRAESDRSVLDNVRQGAGNLLAGAVRGAGSIGATLLAPADIVGDALDGKGLSLESNRQRRADMDGALENLGAQPDSFLYKAGKVGAEIAGTAGAGSAVAAPLRLAGVAPRLTQSIISGGFTTGAPAATTLGARAVDLGVRAIGGGITGAASAALVNPEDVALGGGIGAAFPVAVSAAGKVAHAAGTAYRSLRTPSDASMANKLLEITGMSREELAAALSQQGPEMIPGYQRTVPQILQNPAISQLQRTTKTAGGTALGEAEQLQQAQMREALNRVAPSANTVNEAADAAGGAIQGYALPAREAATTRVRAAFDAVDPFDETALFLPREQMQAAADKYLGPGTFGTGGKAREALRTAEEVGTVSLEAIKPTKATPDETLLAAVRRAGINPNAISSKQFGGELRDLRQSPGMGRLITKNGQPLERVSEAMAERGFIPDGDPATLLNALREGGQQTVVGAGDDTMRAAMERAMGDAPAAEAIARTVPFRTVQNLRSSIGEAADQAAAKGANKEAAALRTMVAEIDSRVNRAAGGSAEAGEFFPRDIADQYRQALDLHARKMQQFETGPQAGMFRRGGDGQASIQGAEIPSKFYSGRASQIEDVQSFKRLIGDRADLAQAMKSYALTEGANTGNAAGDLTSKFLKWMDSRSGANQELFTKQELATIREVGKAVERSIAAESLGRVTGSDTAQKLASLQSNGLLDNKLVSILATRIPGVGSFTGPMLSGLRESAGRDRNKLLSELLANPEKFNDALARGAPGDPNALLQAVTRRALPLTYRAGPVMAAQ